MVTLTDEQQGDIDTVASVVAHRLARKYRPWAEAADVRQDLWVWLLSKRKRLAPLLDAENEDVYKRELKYLERNLYRAGDIMCRQDKAKRSGYKASDEYFYSSSLVAALIEAHCNGGVMVQEQSSARVKRTRTLSEGMEIESMLADVTAALAALEPDQQSLLISLYGEGVPSKDLADQRGVTRQAVEQRASRLIDKIIDELGGVSPY